MIFILCNGTKNRFLFCEASDLYSENCPVHIRSLSRKALVQLACEQFGSGADGFVIVNSGKMDADYDIEWEFYNRDGSSAEMCGNAARCLAFYAMNYRNFSQTEIKLKTLAGLVVIRKKDSFNFSVQMPPHQIIKYHEKVVFDGKEYEYSYINTGVPHIVLKVSTLNRGNLLEVARHFRFMDGVGSFGANVSFYSDEGASLEGITFERGVEDFTLSCGTGAVAIALDIFYGQKFLTQTPASLNIETPGGRLTVQLDINNSFCWLTGPVQFEEEIQISNF